MKQSDCVSQALATCLLAGWLITGCTPGDSATDPRGECRIQRSSSTATNGQIVETVYDYDSAGKLRSKEQTQRTTNRSDLITIAEQYAYDAADLLTRVVVTQAEKTTFADNPSTYTSIATTDYTYTSSRLSAYTQRNVVVQTGPRSPQSQTTITTGTYTYDAGGQLTQTVTNGVTATYQNGRVVAYADPSPFTLENGLITNARFTGTDSKGSPVNLTQTWQYDDQQRVVRYEEALNDSLTTYSTQEWQVGKPAEQSVPPFTGHPVLQSPYGKPGVVARQRLFHVNKQSGGKAYLFLETKATSQLTMQGFVASTTAETTYFTNGQKPDITTTVYTYTGCN